MHAFMYISRALTEGTAPWMPYDYVSMLNVSRTNNINNELTGFLSYQDGHFFQYLEGDRKKLEQAVIKILQDPRHTIVETLLNQDVMQRQFAKWSMPLGRRLMTDQTYIQFIKRFRSCFRNKSPEDRAVLEPFGVYNIIDRESVSSPMLNSPHMHSNKPLAHAV